MNDGISAHFKEEDKSSVSEETARRQLFAYQERLLPESDHVITLISGFPASGSLRNKCPPFKLPSQWFCILVARPRYFA